MILIGSIKHQRDEVAGHWATKEVLSTQGRMSFTQGGKSFIQGGKPLVAVHNEKASAVEPSV